MCLWRGGRLGLYKFVTITDTCRGGGDNEIWGRTSGPGCVVKFVGATKQLINLFWNTLAPVASLTSLTLPPVSLKIAACCHASSLSSISLREAELWLDGGEVYFIVTSRVRIEFSGTQFGCDFWRSFAKMQIRMRISMRSFANMPMRMRICLRSFAKMRSFAIRSFEFDISPRSSVN